MRTTAPHKYFPSAAVPQGGGGPLTPRGACGLRGALVVGEALEKERGGVGWLLRTNGRRVGPGPPVGPGRWQKEGRLWSGMLGNSQRWGRATCGAGEASRSRDSRPLCVCSLYSSGHPPSQAPWESRALTHLYQGVRNLTHVTTSRVICI